MRQVWNALKFNLGLGAGLGLGWLLAQQAWLFGKLSRINAAESLAHHTNAAPRGYQLIEEVTTDIFVKRHTLEDGLERIVYTPRQRQHQTPILMQHGMFHGAWCWQYWQELFAEQGWESVAISLPGHAGSPEQRPIALCTLDYYLGFLKAEADRWPVKPVLMGHSMGGALTQWYLKYAGDLPAAILVAPWLSHSVLIDGLPRAFAVDPWLLPLVSLAWNANPWIRTPQHAAALFITPGALLTPDQLHARLGPESQIAVYQHNPPFWTPPTNVATPMLWVTAEKDAVISVKAATRSAEFYHAEHLIVPNAGHNLMLEQSYRETAVQINAWLEKRVLP